jgi:hypothetical protein
MGRLMAVNLSVAVMAHPSRADMVDELTACLDRPAKVVWDRGNNVEWDTGARAWEAHDPAASHHLVVQDDALVCADLVAGLERGLAHIPQGAAASLFFGRLTPFPHQTTHVAGDADEAGASWVAIDGLHWGVAVVLPTELIAPMLAWRPGERYRKYDQRISAWLHTRRITTFYSCPQLVDHRDTTSLIPGHGLRPGRVTHRFAGADRSALDIDWSGPTLTVGLLRRVNPRPARLASQEDPMPTTATSGDLMIARVNAMVRVGSGRRKIRKGQTTAHVDSWIVRDKPHLWEPIRIDFAHDDPEPTPITQPTPPPPPDPPAATTTTGDPDPDPDVDEPGEDPPAAPAAKDVRAWAKAEGIEVPSRGPLPDDVVERYRAAQRRTEW